MRHLPSRRAATVSVVTPGNRARCRGIARRGGSLQWGEGARGNGGLGLPSRGRVRCAVMPSRRAAMVSAVPQGNRAAWRHSPVGRGGAGRRWCPPPVGGTCAVRCHSISAGGDGLGRPSGESRGVTALSGGKKGDLSKTGDSSQNHLRSENRSHTSSIPSSSIWSLRLACQWARTQRNVEFDYSTPLEASDWYEQGWRASRESNSAGARLVTTTSSSIGGTKTAGVLAS